MSSNEPVSTNPPLPEYHDVTIVEARYSPCEGGRTDFVQNPEIHTRDVTPFVRALLLEEQQREEQYDYFGDSYVAARKDEKVPTNKNNKDEDTQQSQSQQQQSVRINAICNGLRRTRIRILDHDSSMNCLFGDPYPGTSKRLYITYRINNTLSSTTCSFAEHEPVYLLVQPQAHYFRLPEEAASSLARTTTGRSRLPSHALNNHQSTTTTTQSSQLPRTTFTCHSDEVILPLLLPFLEWPERVQCRRVSVVWRDIIKDRGVAVTIDDTSLHCNRLLLRGLLAHSYSSLCNLFLSGTPDVQPGDLADALPQLQKLRSLDISRCTLLGDDTLRLLATSKARHTLQVLYMKGVTQVTDAGLQLVAASCYQLQVLDVSLLTQLTDRGIASLQQLPHLRALFFRDNYKLTHCGTSSTLPLEQLTLWGCIGLHTLPTPLNPRLVLLNLWGCHSLTDTAAEALQGLVHLRSLVVTECHRLTDAFICNGVARYVPQLHHLHVRYCKQLTDTAVAVMAEQLTDLYALDVSFCSRITAGALQNLLEQLRSSLAELRLRNCRGVTDAVLRTIQHDQALAFVDVQQCPHVTTSVWEKGLTDLGFTEEGTGVWRRAARWNAAVERRWVDQLRTRQQHPAA